MATGMKMQDEEERIEMPTKKKKSKINSIGPSKKEAKQRTKEGKVNLIDLFDSLARRFRIHKLSRFWFQQMCVPLNHEHRRVSFYEKSQKTQKEDVSSVTNVFSCGKKVQTPAVLNSS